MGCREDILGELEAAVVKGDRDTAIKAANKAIEEQIPPLEAINNGLIKGMGIVGDKYDKREMFLPQVLVSANTMYGALDVLLPLIPKEDTDRTLKCAIGVCEGDVHDIGKNIVKTMMTASGVTCYDLGRDVPVEDFMDKVRSDGCELVAMSTLMTPTMDGMKYMVDGLVEEGTRDSVKVICGGAPVSQEFVDEIGADMYAVNAQAAVAVVKKSFGL